MDHLRSSRLLALLCMLAMMACLGIGCSDDDDDSSGPSQPAPDPPMADLAPFPVNTSSTDADGCMVLLGAYSELMTFVRYQLYFSLNLPQAEGDSWVWTLMQGGLTVTLAATPNANGWGWVAHMDGTDPDSGTTYDNWMVVSGQTTSDVMSGSFDLYYTNTADVSFHTDFESTGAGSYALTQDAYMLDLDTFEGHNTWSFPADGSGTYDLEVGGYPALHAAWATDGSGSLTYYQTGATVCWDAGGNDAPC